LIYLDETVQALQPLDSAASGCLDNQLPLLLSWFKHFAAMTAGKEDHQYNYNISIDSYTFDELDLAASGEIFTELNLVGTE
jgi:hypothetical protein